VNILFVHEVDYFDKPIYEIHEFPEHLARRGHKVTFLEFNEKVRTPKPARTRQVSGRVLPEVKLSLVTPFYTGWANFDRLLAVFTCIPILFSLFKREKFDAVVLYAVPTYGPQAIFVSKIFRVPLVHRALDVPHKIRRSLYEPFIRIAEAFVYKFSPRISANNQSLAMYCDSIGCRSALSEVHLPPLDLKEFKPVPRSSSLANSLGINVNDHIIVYLGSFFYFSGLKQVIVDFAKTNVLFPAHKLLLIGGGEQDAELRALTRKLEIEDRVIFTGFIPFTEINNYLALAEVAINPMEKIISSNLALPHKVFQYMACGLPVVSSKLSGLYAALGDSSGITWVDGPAKVLGAAINLSEDKALMRQNISSARDALSSRFDMDQVLEDFEDFIFRDLENLEK
jgi:glycosyltransferase involved in cell wall biosynthesis